MVIQSEKQGNICITAKINQDFIKKLESFNDQILRSGMEPSTEVLEFKAIPATDIVAKHLEIKENESVIYMHRKRLADGEPIVTIKTYLPYEECSFVFDHNLEQERLYAILSQSSATTVFRVERIVEAVEATAEDVKLLNIKKGSRFSILRR